MGRQKITAENRKIFIGVSVSPQVFNKINKERGTLPLSSYVSDFLEQNLMKEGQ